MRKYTLLTTQKLNKQIIINLKNCILLLMLMLFTFVDSSAQQISEKEITLQGKFIDANREQILGNYDKAIAIYEEILKDAPKNDGVAYEMARVYDVKEDYEKALRYIRMSIEYAPDNHWYRYYLADLYQKQNNNQEAADVYEELVGLDPNNEDYYKRWAYFLVKANEIKEALKVYNTFEKRLGISEEIIRRKYSLYVGMGENKKAADELQRLIDAFPRSVEYRHLLAGFYEQIGETKLAKDIYSNILKLAPDDPRANMALAGTSGRASDDAQYLQSLITVFEKPDINIDLKIAKLIPFITKVADTGDKNLAISVLELTDILERVHPDEAKPLAAAADLLYYSGEPIKALEKYKKALKLDDTVFLVWEQVLRIYEEAGDYEALRKNSENAMDLFPNKAILYYLNGLANAKLDRPEDALDGFDQASLIAGTDGKLLFDVAIGEGMVYFDLKKYEASEDAFTKALTLNPKAVEALRSYSYTLALRGEKLDQAKQMAKQAVDLAPQDAESLAAYGWVMYKLRDYKEAKKWLEKSLENGGNKEAAFLEHYGDVLFQLNDSEAALQYWVKAQESGSTSDLLEKKIADRHLYE